MGDNLELLTQIQERIIECRRAASEAQDTKLALFLYRLADEVEAEAREADLIGNEAATVTDAERFRQEAEECPALAASAKTVPDKAAWLRLGADWIKLAEKAEPRRRQWLGEE